MPDATPFERNDRWTDLLERFLARGANIRGGNMQVDMIEHILDAVEAIEAHIGGRPKDLDKR